MKFEIATQPSRANLGGVTANVSGDTVNDVQFAINMLSETWNVVTFTLPIKGADNRWHAHGQAYNV